MTERNSPRPDQLARAMRGELAASVSDQALEQWVTVVRDRVLGAWPNLSTDLASFFCHLARLLPAEGWEPGSIPPLVYEDLYLAFACGDGCQEALRMFERDYGRELDTAVGRMQLGHQQAQDARQTIWQKLFVGSDGLPRILEYSGRGALRLWFRVVLMRSLLDDARREKRREEPAPDDWVLDLPSPGDDPEVQYLKQHYGQEFRRAFEQAALGLSAEDRNTLHSYYVGCMSIDAMATAFGIHRATAARRVTRARENLVVATRARLAERLGLSSEALESVIRMIESRLDVSVRRLLGGTQRL